jgi:hypothetical protein
MDGVLREAWGTEALQSFAKSAVGPVLRPQLIISQSLTRER